LVKNKLKNQNQARDAIQKRRNNPEINSQKSNRNSATSGSGRKIQNCDPAYSPNRFTGTTDNGPDQINEKNISKNNGKSFKKRKESTERTRKFSNDDLLSPETPLIGVNFKDFINEDKFNKLGVHLQVLNHTILDYM